MSLVQGVDLEFGLDSRCGLLIDRLLEEREHIALVVLNLETFSGLRFIKVFQTYEIDYRNF